MCDAQRKGLSLRLPTLSCERPVIGESKFLKPQWAKSPSKGVALHVIKNGSTINTLKLDCGAKYYMFGRAPNCDCEDGKPFKIHHPSLSRQHAVIVHGENKETYVVDLDSTKGTYLEENNSKTRCEPYVPTLIRNASILRFGESTRSYLVRMFPKPGKNSDESALSLSQNLFAGMSVSCEEDELFNCNEDLETRLHTNLNSMVNYSNTNSPKRKGMANLFESYRNPSIVASTQEAKHLDTPKTLAHNIEISERSRTSSAECYHSKKRSATSQEPFGNPTRRKSAIIAGDRRVSFSNKCPEFIPRISSQRERSSSSGSSSLDAEDEDACIVYDAKKDSPDASLEELISESHTSSESKNLHECMTPSSTKSLKIPYLKRNFGHSNKQNNIFSKELTNKLEPSNENPETGQTKRKAFIAIDGLSRLHNTLFPHDSEATLSDKPFADGSRRTTRFFGEKPSTNILEPKSPIASLRELELQTDKPTVSPKALLSSTWKSRSANDTSSNHATSVAAAAAAFSTFKALQTTRKTNS